MDKKPTYEDLEQRIEALEKRVLFGEEEREEKYRLIIETLPQGVQEVDTSGKIVFANSAYHRMSGGIPRNSGDMILNSNQKLHRIKR